MVNENLSVAAKRAKNARVIKDLVATGSVTRD
jgi:hypothetical protein